MQLRNLMWLAKERVVWEPRATCGDCLIFQECTTKKGLLSAPACNDFVAVGALQLKGEVRGCLVVEPIGNGLYAWKLADQRGLSTMDKEEKEWKIEIAGHELYFAKTTSPSSFQGKLPYRTPHKKDVEAWINEEVKSKPLSSIYATTKKYIGTVLELEEEFHVSMLALFVVQSWLRQASTLAFNIDVAGPFGGGKTTVLEAIAEVTYHPVLGVTSAASLGRMNDKYGLTWVLDEYDQHRTNLSDLFVRQGYREGNRIFRYDPDTHKEEFFNAFGCKLISYHEELETALAQRSLTHIIISKSPDHRIPIINTVRSVLSYPIFLDYWCWHMDNITDIKQKTRLQPKLTQSLEVLLDERTEYTPEVAQQIRKVIYHQIIEELTPEEREFISKLKGRVGELGFLAINVARTTGIDVIGDLTTALERKTLEEEQEEELDFAEVIKALLAQKYYGEEKEAIPKKQFYKECKAKIEEEYGVPLSAKRFGMVLRDLGFREGVNVKRVAKQRFLILDKKIVDQLPKIEAETEKKEEQLKPEEWKNVFKPS